MNKNKQTNIIVTFINSLNCCVHCLSFNKIIKIHIIKLLSYAQKIKLIITI